MHKFMYIYKHIYLDDIHKKIIFMYIYVCVRVGVLKCMSRMCVCMNNQDMSSCAGKYGRV